MKIKLNGAAGGEVTGSAYLVRTKRATILVDAGMFQGGRPSEAKNRLPSGVRPEEIEAVLLTHAHLDHTGRLPLLIKHGFSGPVYATSATIDLAEIILKDCARIQLQDAERKTRKAAQRDLPLVDPLYEPDDVEPFCSSTHPVKFQKPVQVADGVTARWVEAGHMLGSGCIELTVEEDGRQKVVPIFGQRIPVRATIHTLNGFSGHADQSELLKWFSTLAPAKPKVFITHGEDRSRGTLAKLIQQRFKLSASLPKQGEVIDI